MDILFFAVDFPNWCDPTNGVFNLHLVRALARRHAVRVVAPIPWVNELRARLRGRRGAPHGRVETTGTVEISRPVYLYPPRVMRTAYAWFYWASVRGTVRAMLKARTPDAVVGYWAHPDGAVAARVARSIGVPSAVIIGGSDVLLLPQDPGRRRKVKEALDAVDVVVAVSRDLREKVVAMGVPPGKVVVWSQGVDREVFHPGDRAEARGRVGIPAGGRALVWVGRMVPVKGLDVLIAACDTPEARGLDFHVYLVGDGPLRAALEQDVRSRGLAARFTFVGAQPNRDLPDWYRAADLTVLPSRSEGLPNVLRESVACGTPFVASDVGGVPEIAASGSGRLAPPGDPAALGRQIALALEDGPPRASATGQVGWDEAADTLVAFLGRRAGPFPTPTPAEGRHGNLV